MLDIIVENQIKEYLENKVPVFINYTDESGNWLYSIQVDGTDFWLISFETEEQAKQYCVENDLPIV